MPPTVYRDGPFGPGSVQLWVEQQSDDPKQLVSLRLDAAVLRWFKRTGPGYQSRIGDVLKRHVTRQSAARKKKAASG